MYSNKKWRFSKKRRHLICFAFAVPTHVSRTFCVEEMQCKAGTEEQVGILVNAGCVKNRPNGSLQLHVLDVHRVHKFSLMEGGIDSFSVLHADILGKIGTYKCKSLISTEDRKSP